MRDQYFGWRESVGLLEVFFIQGLPLPMLILLANFAARSWLLVFNALFLVLRSELCSAPPEPIIGDPGATGCHPYVTFP
jgi:hypothetical protein